MVFFLQRTIRYSWKNKLWELVLWPKTVWRTFSQTKLDSGLEQRISFINMKMLKTCRNWFASRFSFQRHFMHGLQFKKYLIFSVVILPNKVIFFYGFVYNLILSLQKIRVKTLFSCVRCEDPMDFGLQGNSVLCPHCATGHLAPPQGKDDNHMVWTCQSCHKSVSGEKV